MSRSSAADSALPGRWDEGEEEEEGEEEAEGEEGMPTQGGGSDLDSDADGEGSKEEEEVEEEVEEVMEVEEEEEEEVMEGEEEEEAEEDAEEADSGGEEEIEEGEEAEEGAKDLDGEGDDEEGEEEEEEQAEGGGGAADSSPDSPVPVDKGVDDSGQQIKPEEQDDGLKLLHSTTYTSEANSMLHTLVGEALGEKKTSSDIQNVENGHKILGDQQLPTHNDSVNAEKPESLHLKEKELVDVTQKRCRDGDLDGILHLEKEPSNLDRQEYSQKIDFEPTSSMPISPVAGYLENCNKRPAVVCAFFARGWCIKGNSCRFLHQKDEDVARQAAKGNLTGPSSRIDLEEETGLKHEVGRFYTLPESVISTAENSSSKSLQRALVRAYGGHELRDFQDKDSQSLFQTDLSLGTKTQNVGVQLTTANHGFYPDRQRTTYSDEASIPGGRRLSFQLSEFPQTSITQAEDVKSFDASSGSVKLDYHLTSIDGGQSTTGSFISRKFQGEGETHPELSKIEYANDESFSGESPVTKNSFIPEYRYCSSNSLMPSSFSLSSSTPLANDRSTVGSVAQSYNLPSLHNPKTSYFTKGLLDSGFQNHLSHFLPSNSSLAQVKFCSSHGSIPLSTEDVGTYKRFDYEGGYHGSRSSSPFSQFGPEKLWRQEISGSTSVSAEKKVSLGDGWEPSMPFRSSFYCPPASAASPGNQYDPLSDSIEPPQSLSNQHKNVDSVQKGSDGPGYNDLNHQISFLKSHESTVSKSEYGAVWYPSANAGVSGLVTLDGVNRSSVLKEKSWSPGHVIDVGNVKETDYEDNLRNHEDKYRHHRETKALKNFRSCLVEFVKDLVKPAWREGHLSKDAHKMVVKKAAEKILSAFQPHQVPSTTDAINQYLSASRPKIVKLVEGYVEKYAKS